MRLTAFGFAFLFSLAYLSRIVYFVWNKERKRQIDRKE